MSYNIAIDGPAGAGKSTIARAVAEKMNLIYIDTGAMYRAMSLAMVRAGISLESEEAVASACQSVNITLGYERGGQVVYLNGEDVTSLLRTEEVGGAASVISVYPPVRKKLVELQQELAAKADCVMDGRDIGTHVLPHADVKIFLTASSDVRAARRCEELRARGMESDFETIKRDIEERDYRDMNRVASPLRQAEDAVLVDTSCMNIGQVVERILELCGKKEA